MRKPLPTRVMDTIESICKVVRKECLGNEDRIEASVLSDLFEVEDIGDYITYVAVLAAKINNEQRLYSFFYDGSLFIFNRKYLEEIPTIPREAFSKSSLAERILITLTDEEKTALKRHFREEIKKDEYVNEEDDE